MEREVTSSHEIQSVKVQLADGTIMDAEITFTNGLRIHIEGVGYFTGKGNDYFSQLADVRSQLEQLGIKVLCFGARTDVWASGLQRDMGLGYRAYLLSADVPGRKPAQCIFDYSPPEKIGTVEEQRQYHEVWSRGRCR